MDDVGERGTLESEDVCDKLRPIADRLDAAVTDSNVDAIYDAAIDLNEGADFMSLIDVFANEEIEPDDANDKDAWTLLRRLVEILRKSVDIMLEDCSNNKK